MERAGFDRAPIYELLHEAERIVYTVYGQVTPFVPVKIKRNGYEKLSPLLQKRHEAYFLRENAFHIQERQRRKAFFDKEIELIRQNVIDAGYTPTDLANELRSITADQSRQKAIDAALKPIEPKK